MRAVFATAGLWLAVFAGPVAQTRSVFPGTLDQHPVIDYRGGVLSDVVTGLQRELASGSATLPFDSAHGYLRALLARLDVPVESQVLIFSKTGLQHPFTRPDNPRALYFNDRVVIGFIPGAPVIEMASHDPRQGVIFQTLKQNGVAPEMARPDRCLGCHLSANSMSVPGILVRSMSTAPDGRAMPQAGSFVIDHRSPLAQRWAGWYVTGVAPSVQHMGRAVTADLDLSKYPLRTSDVAALLVFDHQGHAINVLTRLGWETRAAAAEGRLDFTTGELGDILNEAATYLVFEGETPIAAPVHAESAFVKSFAAAGPRDRHGRSLREFDLQTRLFKHRCSYMIYSPAFEALPDEARSALLARMRSKISDRATIEILDDTKPRWRE